MFLVLPFGLTSAPYVYTKVTRQLVKKWRSEGHKVVIFLDDGILCGFSEVATTSNAKVKQDLFSSGFVAKVEKSLWSPTQVIEWLGLGFDTLSLTMSFPER